MLYVKVKIWLKPTSGVNKNIPTPTSGSKKKGNSAFQEKCIVFGVGNSDIYC